MKNTTYLFCFLLAITSAYARQANDDFAGAILLTSNYCSINNTEFNNNGYSGDGIRPANWQYGPNANAWFKFQATGSVIDIDLRDGSSFDDALLALFNANQQDVASVGYNGSGNRSLSYDGLIVGDWYYISVGTRSSSSTDTGWFGLCLDSPTPPVPNDLKENAKELTPEPCSGATPFDNTGFANQLTKPANWSTNGDSDAWFKFQALDEGVEFNLNPGTMGFAKFAIYSSSFQELTSSESDLSNPLSVNRIRYSGLSIGTGQWYYLRVDSKTSGEAGTFGLCPIYFTPSNDDFADAKNLSANYCSTDYSEFNNNGFTGDGIRPTNWQYGPYANAWFKFQATTSHVDIDLVAGSSFDDALLALFDANQQDVASVGYNGSGSRSLSHTGLIVGDWYYISVGTRTSSSGDTGWFGLCIDSREVYDDFASAQLIDANHCGGPLDFNNDGYTPDGYRPSNWQYGPNTNAWFKFTATGNTVNVNLMAGPGFDDAMMALFDVNQVELQSVGYNGSGNLALTYGGLISGSMYYIAVDNQSLGDAGDFGLCLVSMDTYDDFSNAMTLGADHCSGIIDEFSNLGYSGNGVIPSNWESGPHANAWFKFQATSIAVSINLSVGSNFDGAMLALYDANQQELQSVGGSGPANKVLSYAGLTVGQWYYISADSQFSDEGTFGLCLAPFDPYDDFSSALVVGSNDCNPTTEYSNLGYTSDGIKPTNWPNGPNSNAWFKFQATGNSVEVSVNYGMNFYNEMLALFDANQLELASQGGPGLLSYGSLTVGEWYYVAVDNQLSGGTGNFGLCLVSLDTYDDFGTAKLIDSNSCSGYNNEFNNEGYTPDGFRPSNWQYGPNTNAWFKFVATGNTIQINLNAGSSFDDAMLALFDANQVELESVGYNGSGTRSLTYGGLSSGSEYFIAVDNQSLADAGNFGLCLVSSDAYDDFSTARTIDSNSCSGNNNEFNNDGYTPDGFRPSNWQYGPNNNAWFKFIATGNTVQINLSAGASFADAMLALFDANQVELESVGFNGSVNQSLTYGGLVSGDTYYLAIDNQSPGDTGNFGLCLVSSDGYDDFSTAKTIDSNSCSGNNNEFNNDGYTPDGFRPSNWQYGPNTNAWFKFVATGNTVQIDLNAGSSFDDAMLALFDANQMELASVGYNGSGNRSLTYGGLTYGDEYFLAIDNQSLGDAGSFGLCLVSSDTYDDFSNAKTIDSNSCSGNSNEYNNIGYSSDGPRPNSWENGPNVNAWFKFQATTAAVTINLSEGESFDGGMLALYDGSQQELQSVGDYGSNELSYAGLTVGQWYYVSVDSRLNDQGNFGLCLISSDPYDDFISAKLIDSNSCSGDINEYNNIGYSADGPVPNQWESGPNANAWFKFQATTAAVTVNLSEGTNFDRGMLALYDGSQQELQSIGDSGPDELSYVGLTVGQWYYISVDSRYSNEGNFGLCLTSSDPYDDFSDALSVSANHCSSSNTEFNNNGYTADGIKPANWQSGPNSNAWFKFLALGNAIDITVQEGPGFSGGMLSLFDVNQVELVSVGSSGNPLSYGGLVAGQWYYIAVDNQNLGDDGSFGLCLVSSSNNDVASGALVLGSNFCSENTNSFSNHGFSGEIAGVSNWSSSARVDAWFKFQATTDGIDIGVSGDSNFSGVRLALFDSNLSEVASVGSNGSSNNSLVYGGLAAGQWYLIAVDNSNFVQGDFDLCLSSFTSNNDFVNAQTVQATHCSASNNEFNNAGYTADGQQPSNWNYGPNVNAWFKFQATTNAIDVSLNGGTDFGNAMLALFDANQQELSSVGPNGSHNKSISYIGLTVGQWYYISVDNRYAYEAGFFGLCLNAYDHNDFANGATILGSNTCSGNVNEFSTDGYTGDGITPSNWSSSPNSNAWFKFQATTKGIEIDLNGGTDFHDARLAIFDSNQQELRSVGADGSNNKYLVYGGLAVGQWYLVAVDNTSNADTGNFGLCLNSFVPYDDFGNAKVVDANSCSGNSDEFNNYGYTADGIRPSGSPSGPTANAWFKFQAVQNTIHIELDRGTGFGSGEVALFDASNMELSGDDLGTALSFGLLTAGEWYYISVDQNSYGIGSDSFGNFGLCLNSSDTYDYFETALIIDSNSCSGDTNQFNNSGYSGDGPKPHDWQNFPKTNAWFKFQATGNLLDFELNGGADFDGAMVALFDDDQQVLFSEGHSGVSGDKSFRYVGLTVGEWYFISVDNNFVGGDFGLCLSSFNSNDIFENAVVLMGNHCSGGTEFSNEQFNGDGYQPSNWSRDPEAIAWFKFQAVDPTIIVRLNPSSIQYGMLALFDENRMELSSSDHFGRYGSPELAYGELVSGAWYYVSVGNRDEDDRGTFGLCLTTPPNTFDFKNHATTLTSIEDYCSVQGAFSNSGATGDGPTPSNWNNEGPVHNVWFKFQATSKSANITLDSETLEYGRMAVFAEEGSEVASVNYATGGSSHRFDNRVMAIRNQLSPGDWYYLEVDATNRDGNGSFGLCVKSGKHEAPSTAKLITSEVYCSVPNEFSNDANGAFGSQPSNWDIAPNANVWFKFQATKNSVKVTADLNLLAIYDDSLNELNSSASGVVAHSNLTIGQEYYVTVDGSEYLSGSLNEPVTGSFGLCLEQKNTNGHKSNATVITSTDNYCSSSYEFTTEFASFDGFVPAGWPASFGGNVWFKFQATADAVKVSTEAQHVAFTDDLDNDLASFTSDEGGSAYTNLEIGQWYYISISSPMVGLETPVGPQARFTLCADQFEAADFKSTAYELPDVTNFASGIYSNQFTTPDGAPASHWDNEIHNNMWFKFQAAKSGVKIGFQGIEVSGLDYADARMAVYAMDDSEVELSKTLNYSDTLNNWYTNLTVGDWYYLSVDENMSDFNANDFKLYFESFESNDLIVNAETIVVDGEYCSDLAGVSNELATLDVINWEYPFVLNGNVWYKFQATATGVTLDLKTGYAEGTAQWLKLALLDENQNILKKSEYSSSAIYRRDRDLSLSQLGLTVGNWYYISVDSHVPGDFTLCARSFEHNDDLVNTITIDTQMSYCENFNSPIATFDGPPSPSSNDQPNVWFKVLAQSSTIKVTASNRSVILYDENMNLVTDNSTQRRRALLYSGLETGSWYYMSIVVGSGNVDYYLCVDFLEVNDIPTDAIAIDYLPYQTRDYASDPNYIGIDPRSQFLLENATANGTKPSSWQEGPNTNTWFSFTARYNSTTLAISSVDGNAALADPMVAFFDQSMNELASVGYNPSNGTEGQLTYDGFVAGETYFVAIDAKSTSDRSAPYTFSLSSCNSATYTTGSIAVTDPVVCKGEVPERIVSTNDAIYSGSLHYAWFQSTNGPDGYFYSVNENDPFLDFDGSLTQTSWFKRRTKAIGSCDGEYKYSNVVKIEALGDEAIFEDQTVCMGGAASPFAIVTPIEGPVSSYEWERSTTSPTSGFSVVPNSNVVAVTPATDINSWYRRRSIFAFGCTSEYSDAVKLTLSDLTPGSISPDLETCPGQTITLSSVNPGSAGGTVYYSWEKSIVSASSGFSAILGGSSGNYYTQQTESVAWYRRIATANDCEVRTAATMVTLVSATPSITADKTVLIDNSPATLSAGANCGGSNVWTRDGIQISTTSLVVAYQPGIYTLTRGGESTSIEITSNRTFWSVGNGNWESTSIWSAAEGGSVIPAYPTASDRVTIKGKSITVDDVRVSKKITVLTTTSGTRLHVLPTGDLTVQGEIEIVKGSGVDNTSAIVVDKGASLKIIED